MDARCNSRLVLSFEGHGEQLRLCRTDVEHPLLSDLASEIHSGRLSTTADRLPWQPAVKALALFLVRASMLAADRGAEAGACDMTGGRPSPASSLFDSFEKNLKWHDCLGRTASAIPLLRTILRVRAEGNGFRVRLDPAYMRPDAVQVEWQGERLTDRGRLEVVRAALAEQCHAAAGYHQAPLATGMPGLRIVDDQIVLLGAREMRFDLNARVNRTVGGAILDRDGRFHADNLRAISEYYGLGPSNSGAGAGRLGAVVGSLLQDMEAHFRARTGRHRFVSTNASVDSRGSSSWHEDRAVAELVKKSHGLLARRSARHEVWRVFLLRSPARRVASGLELQLFYAVLAENAHLGVNVAVTTFDSLPGELAPQFAEFHCVPGRRVFVSVPPHYALAEFDRLRHADAAVVGYYSDLAAGLVDRAADPGDDGVFAWPGGTIEDLRTRLSALDLAASDVRA